MSTHTPRRHLARLMAVFTATSLMATSVTPVQANIIKDMEDVYNDVGKMPKAFYKDAVKTTKDTQNGLLNLPADVASDFVNSTQVKGPSALHGQSFNTFIGGQMVQHTPVRNLQLMSIEAPHFSAGCGGIDMYLGSISHLDGSKIVSFVKSVAMNMQGVIVQLGLKAITPLLGSTIEWAKEVADKINGFNINSCNMAKGLVGGAASAFDMSDNDDCRSAMSADAEKKMNAAEAQEQCMGQKQIKALDDMAKSDKPEKKNLISFKGNMTWEALKLATNMKGEVMDVDEREIIMSMVGSWIYRLDNQPRDTKPATSTPPGTTPAPAPDDASAGENPPETDGYDAKKQSGDGATSTQISPEPLFPTITDMQALLYGNDAPPESATPTAPAASSPGASPATTAGNANVYVTVWKCDENERCLNPKKTALPLVSYVEKVRAVWQSIADSIRARNVELNQTQLDFINQSRLPVYKMMAVSVKNMGSDLDSLLINNYKEVVAADYVIAMIQRNMLAGQQALNNKFKWTKSQQDDMRSIIASSTDCLNSLRVQYREANSKIADMDATMRSMTQIEEQLTIAMPRPVQRAANR